MDSLADLARTPEKPAGKQCHTGWALDYLTQHAPDDAGHLRGALANRAATATDIARALNAADLLPTQIRRHSIQRHRNAECDCPQENR